MKAKMFLAKIDIVDKAMRWTKKKKEDKAGNIRSKRRISAQHYKDNKGMVSRVLCL